MKHKYKVGEKVILDGEEVVIEQTGININKMPIYKINGQWYHEHELEDWWPECPV